MSGRSAFVAFLLGSAAILTAGCAGSSAPAGWLEIPSKVRSQAYGAWAEVDYEERTSPQKLLGELIAFQEDSLFVLTEGGLVGVPTSSVVRAKLTSHNSNAVLLGLWTLGGTLSTPSHGWGLILSAPAWLLIGNITTVAHSHTSNKHFPDKSWEELRMYARFPQGLPPGLDRKSLAPKPSAY